MQPIETALSSLAAGLIAWGSEFESLGDVIDAKTNTELDRLEAFSELRGASNDESHVVLGSTLSLVRRATQEAFCVAVAVTTAPPADAAANLVAWQFGFWRDGGRPPVAFVSPVYAMPPDAGILLVLEELSPAAHETVRTFVAEAGVTDQAFVSYVREDRPAIERLCEDLAGQGVSTWTDKDQIQPGKRWKDAIRRAIHDGSAFLACFSTAYESKPRTYMNEELTLAVEELRLRPRNRSWFFPVLLEDVEIPSISIGGGETLRDLQGISLAPDWGTGVGRLARAVRDAHGRPRVDGAAAEPAAGENDA